MEHRFTSEEAAHFYSVKAADEFAIAVPCLNRMSPAEFVQGAVSVDEIISDPAVLARSLRASTHHTGEVAIDRDLELAHRLSK